MAIGPIAATMAVYAIFHKKINRVVQCVAAGVAEAAKIMTRSMRK